MGLGLAAHVPAWCCRSGSRGASMRRRPFGQPAPPASAAGRRSACGRQQQDQLDKIGWPLSLADAQSWLTAGGVLQVQHCNARMVGVGSGTRPAMHAEDGLSLRVPVHLESQGVQRRHGQHAPLVRLRCWVQPPHRSRYGACERATKPQIKALLRSTVVRKARLLFQRTCMRSRPPLALG